MIVLDPSAAVDWLLQTAAGQSHAGTQASRIARGGAVSSRWRGSSRSAGSSYYSGSSSRAPAANLAIASQSFCLDAAHIMLAEKLGAALVTRDGRLATASGHAAAIELF
jgi:hypothetical protein